MIFTPFEFSVPSPIAASFTSGEKAIGVTNPLSATPARSTYSISRWIYLNAGTYIIRCAAKSSATFLLNTVHEHLGVRKEQKQLLFTCTEAQGVIEREVFVPKAGVRKLDVIMRNITASTADCYVVFNIRRSGNLIYASGVSGFLASDSASFPAASMPAVPDYRQFLPVFNIAPNWKEGVLERVEYLTNVLASDTDAEQRRMMRSHPRRSFEASFLREKSVRSRLDAFITGYGHSEFMVPLWHESLRLPYGDPKETVVVPFDGYNLVSDGSATSNGAYYSCGLDFLYDLISDGTVDSDGSESSDGYKD